MLYNLNLYSAVHQCISIKPEGGKRNSIRKKPITQEKKMGSTDISKTENIKWSINTEKGIQYHVQLW